MSIFKVTPKETLHNGSAWIRRAFVSASRPSLRAAKIDKETCGKIIEAAETAKDGSKEVVTEVKKVTTAVREKVGNVAGNMVADVAHKGIEKAAETAETKKSKDILDTVKTAAEAFKDRSKDK